MFSGLFFREEAGRRKRRHKYSFPKEHCRRKILPDAEKISERREKFTENFGLEGLFPALKWLSKRAEKGIVGREQRKKALFGGFSKPLKTKK